MNRAIACSPATHRRRRIGWALSAAMLVLILAGLPILAGCNVQAGVDTTVNTDGSGTVGMRLVADKELQDALSGVVQGVGGEAGAILGILGELGAFTDTPLSADDLFDLILGQIPGDWTVERGTDDSGARWITLTRPFSSPEELEQILSGRFLGAVIATDQLSLTQDQGFFASTTSYSATADAGSITSRGESVTGYTQAILGDLLTVENRVTLPGSIKDNNADEVRGNTLVWTMGTSGAREMSAQSTVYHWGAIIGVIIAGLVVVIGGVVAAILLARRRKPAPQPPAETQASEALTAAPEAAAPTAEVAAITPPPAPAAEVAGAAAAVGATEAPIAEEEEPAPTPAEVAPAEAVADEQAEPAPPIVPAAEPEVPADEPELPAEEPEVPAVPAEAAPDTMPPVGAATGAAAAAESAPRPIVPIPLRPTKAQPARNDAPEVAPDAGPEATGDIPEEGAAAQGGRAQAPEDGSPSP